METLKLLRGNLSVQETATLLNLSRDAIFKIERGERIPNLETLLQYFKYFKPPAKQFLDNLIADLEKL